MRSKRSAVIFLGMSWLAGTAWADADPLEWRPPSRPIEFRNRLTDAEYQRRAGPFLARLPQARKEAAGKLPDHGLQLSGVLAFGPLGEQGVTASDVIAKADGKDLWGRWTEPRPEPARLQVYSPRQDRFREVKVATDLGPLFSVYRRPDLAYLRSKARKVAWDRDAFVGLVAAASAPDLAETAWHRALAAGFPRNRLCLASGALLALAQGRPEAALDFWYEAEHAAGSESLDPLLAYRVMIANDKLEQARDLARKHPELFPKIAAGLEGLIALHHARSPQDRTAPPPSVQARTMHRRDARGNLIGGNQTAENQFLDLLTRRDTFHAGSASNYFSLVDFTAERALTHFDLGLSLTIAATDNQRADFVKLVRLVLIGSRKNHDREDAEPALIGHVEIEVPSGFSLTSFEPGGAVYFPDPLVAADAKTRNSIRLLRVGGQLEVFINERRVLYQPIDPEIVLRQIRFQSVGTTIDVTGFTLDELIPRL